MLVGGHGLENLCLWVHLDDLIDDFVLIFFISPFFCCSNTKFFLQPLKNDRFLINKSRYDSIDSYLSEEGRCYNDLQLVYDKEIYEELMAEGMSFAVFQSML